MKIDKILSASILTKVKDNVGLFGLEARSRDETIISRNSGLLTSYFAGVNAREEGLMLGNRMFMELAWVEVRGLGH